MGTELKASLAGQDIWDGRQATWGAPPLSENGPSIYVVTFMTDRLLVPGDVGQAMAKAFRHIRAAALSDAAIRDAREKLAAFYETWMFEPTYRILADHLAASTFAGRDPAEVKNITARLRAVKANDVRRVFDKYLLRPRPLLIVLPPNAG
jgi:predicted Zn-dependent peptidase